MCRYALVTKPNVVVLEVLSDVVLALSRDLFKSWRGLELLQTAVSTAP
jgi:hypothetical protein